ncbi:TetR/AcrR family transcriptional regulator [Motiliproteus coralliicola]|uniref:TetR/AcrR family transcriptional regulator n=1 Tax=Motiliproteus coralliicola TaxID=2283196 RepID=A0A369WXG1_9GAMM|nr:TetR/AcrR family transcriptional regulator [Motiliproteus coralliicola]RDE25214.1 TetR/AcrR family transcriptional regulator [Motiliproteus coralliicola]
MNSNKDKSPDSRSSRELWLSAAFEALVQNGVGAVKIQPLAEQLKLSRTSFYWYFKDRKALLAALIEEWNHKNTGGLTAASEAYAESLAEAVLNVISAFLDPNQFDSKLDFAIRSWALQDPDVMEEVRIADEVRLQALTAMFEKHGYDSHDADVRARTIYLVQIGYISMQVQEDLATRMARIPNYVATYTGQQPTPNEIARFHARHHFVPES